MFCEGCGTQIQSGLNYCSRCGRRVADTWKSDKSRRSPLVVAGNIAGVGFFAFIFVVLILTKNGIPPDTLLRITLFYFAALFGICFMFLRYARSSEGTESTARSTSGMTDPAYLRPATTAQLEEARQFDVGSVTDATTRTLDKVPVREQQN